MKELLDWQHLSFAHPFFFGLLLLVPVMIWWQVRSRKGDTPSLRLTTLAGIDRNSIGGRAQWRPVLFVLRIVTLVALTIALARPQSSNTTENIDSEGIDIVLAIDISGSMLAEDFKPRRMEAAKAAALKFVDQRPTDRIGLVLFAGESLTMCPITIDHNILKEQIAALHTGMVADGTAIGMGLGTAVDRLRSMKSKSKVVILLTDGVNNVSTPISPLTALEIAKLYKIKVYTVGIGSNAPDADIVYPTPNGPQRMKIKVEIDEQLMKHIANETGGKYFRATSNRTLEGVYNEIDKMEKTHIDITSYKHYAELFFPFAMLAVICLALELLLRYTVFRSIT